MPQENVEIVRRIYEGGLFDRDQVQLLDLLDPDVEYVNPPEAIDPGIRRGVDEFMDALRNASELFDSARNELLEVFDGDEVVVASVNFHTRGRGSEVEIVQEEVHTWTFRNGRIVRLEWGRDLDAGLEAAGVRRSA